MFLCIESRFYVIMNNEIANSKSSATCETLSLLKFSEILADISST